MAHAASTNTSTVRDVFGRTHTLTPGLIDQGAQIAFTTGHCANLALALHAATGWDIVVLIEASSTYTELADSGALHAANTGNQIPTHVLDELWAHVMVATPDGLLLDVNGYTDKDTLLAHYEGIEDGDGTLPNARDRKRLVSASAAQVSALPSIAPTFGTAGLGANFTAAVLALPQRPKLPWPWRNAAADAAAALNQNVDDMVADGWTFNAAAAAAARDLENDTSLLGELAARNMLTPQMADIASVLLAEAGAA